MTVALLLRYWREGAIALLILVTVGFCRSRDSALRAEGVAKEQNRVADSTLKILGPKAAKAETLYVRDTIELVRTLARIDSLRDTITLHLTDTVRVREYIAASDSAIHACRETASSCSLNLKIKDEEIAAWKSKAEAAQGAAPRQHFGLGLSLGPAVVWNGKFAAGVGGSIGLTYRW